MSEKEANQIIWSIHETHPDLVEHVREKLAEVVDPEIGMNIIQLGLVRDVEIENDEDDPYHTFLPIWSGHDRSNPRESCGGIEQACHNRNGHGAMGFLDDGRSICARLGHVRLIILGIRISNLKKTSLQK